MYDKICDCPNGSKMPSQEIYKIFFFNYLNILKHLPNYFDVY